LAAADVIISSTGAQRPIIDRAMLKSAIALRPSRPMFLIDIAVPRDVTADAADLENLFLYDIDDLQNVVSEHVNSRKSEAEKAEAIIESEAAEFGDVLRAFTLVPLIRALREHAENMRKAEVDRFLAQHAEISQNLREDFERMHQRL